MELRDVSRETPRASTFGQRFTFLLVRLRGLGYMGTDKELGARYLELPSSRVAEYKARAAPPPADVIEKIAVGAKVDPGWLTYGDRSQAPAPKGFGQWLATAFPQPVAHPQHALDVAGAAGVAPEGEVSAEDLLKRVQKAKPAAKHAGGKGDKGA